MNAEMFCYWLQGFFEIHSGGEQPLAPFTHKQMAMIQEHLQLVFKKVTGKKEPLPPVAPKEMTEEEVRKIVEEIGKIGRSPPIPAPWNEQTRPWWQDPYQPQIYCSNGSSGLRVECIDTSKTSDADLDCTRTVREDGSVMTTNATGQTHTVQAPPLDPNKPIFIC